MEHGHIDAGGKIVKIGRDGVVRAVEPTQADLDQRVIDAAKPRDRNPKTSPLEARIAALETAVRDLQG
jgi:hypothetical protein